MSVAITLESRNFGRRAASVVSALLVAFLTWSAPAQAVIGMNVLIEGTETLSVGEHGTIHVWLTNQNTGADQAATNTVDVLLLTPACHAPQSMVCASGNEDPPVFTLKSATGLVGTVCAGYVFNIVPIAASPGVFQLTSSAPITLPGTGSLCRIQIPFIALNKPKGDSTTSINGTQTLTSLFANVRSSTGGQINATGSHLVTVELGCSLDIDGNGTIDALTDGLLILRAMFGLTGTAVTSGAVAANATRKTWQDQSSNTNARCGTNYP